MFCAPLATVILVGCEIQGGDIEITSKLRIIHAIAGQGPIDFWIDSNRVAATPHMAEQATATKRSSQRRTLFGCFLRAHLRAVIQLLSSFERHSSCSRLHR